MLQIGSLVDGKYKILSEIGRGGMSVVYMAINEKANKTWAVKEVRKDGVLDFEAVKQGLVVETDMLKRLRHPHLPSIVDVIEDQESFLIVMDYIEGNSLAKALDEYGAQPQDYVIDWAKQLCDVLGYLHTREPAIIYRDMKPANVMLKPDGNLTLIDFGTAREFKAKNLADTTCLGTIGYAAPEQFGGMGQTDGRTDIYCLGATLYHLVTGCNPSEPPYEIKPIRQINPALSSGLERIIQKCTQRNPDDRYQSAAELMYALEHYEEIDDRFRKKQKRKLGSFIAMAALTVLFAAGGIGLNIASRQVAAASYSDMIEQAEKASSYEEKVELYTDCIDIPKEASRPEAYLGLIAAYKEDGEFSVEEAQQLEKLIVNNKGELQEDPQNYTDVCFETGKLFWYYYNYGDGSNNQITKAKSAVVWFQDVMDYAPEGYPNLGMATVYKNIGVFYRDITTAITEASDKGRYAPLLENLTELVNTVAQDESESEVVRLELLELTRSALQQYATKFKVDGVPRESVFALLDDIDVISDSVITTEGTRPEELKQSIRDMLEDTYSAVEVAYGTEDRGGNGQ